MPRVMRIAREDVRIAGEKIGERAGLEALQQSRVWLRDLRPRDRVASERARSVRLAALDALRLQEAHLKLAFRHRRLRWGSGFAARCIRFSQSSRRYARARAAQNTHHRQGAAAGLPARAPHLLSAVRPRFGSDKPRSATVALRASAHP